MNEHKITYDSMYPYTYECEVQSDPTLRYFLRETTFDVDKLERQVSIRIAAAKIALGRYIDKLAKYYSL